MPPGKRGTAAPSFWPFGRCRCSGRKASSGFLGDIRYRGGRDQHIADAHSGLEILGMSRVGFQPAPEPIDIDLEHMALAQIVRSPDVLQQESLCDDAPDVLREIRQEPVFGRRERHFLSGQCDQVLCIINP